MHRKIAVVAAAGGLLVTAASATAQRALPGLQARRGTAPVEREFPLAVRGSWSDRSLVFDALPARAEALRAERAIRFSDVAVPTGTGFDSVDLELLRVRVIANDAEWHVNGERVGGTRELEAMHTLWTGQVVGEPDSQVYLAFTSSGSWGWIDRAGDRVHLFSAPDEETEAWSESFSVLVHESDPMLAGGAPTFECETLIPPGGPSSAPSGVRPELPTAQVGNTSYECKIALETDYQYYQEFNDVDAATNYAVALFGGITCRYLAANTFITLPYLGVYDNILDPWVSQDAGGNASALLNEFRVAWGGQAFPGNAHLANFLSGANLGGGVAYLDVLCNNSFGFGVSGNLHGDTPLPVVNKHILNWDFVVAAHEAGHNFGTPHTHDYCPPVDECASSTAGWGPCQDERNCIASGTIMSYCHTCSGGMLNIQPRFDPTVAANILSHVQSSCLPSYSPASFTVRNGGGSNPAGYSALTDPIIGEDWLVEVDHVTSGATASFVGVGYRGTANMMLSRGELLIRPPTLKPISQSNDGSHVFPIAKDLELLGQTYWTQAATFKPGEIRFQNAIDVFLGF